MLIELVIKSSIKYYYCDICVFETFQELLKNYIYIRLLFSYDHT